MILSPVGADQDLTDVVTKIALNLQQRAAGGSLARAHGPENRHPGIQAPVRKGEPRGIEYLMAFDRVVQFSDHQAGGLVRGRDRPGGESAPGGDPARARGKPHAPRAREQKTRSESDDPRHGVVPDAARRDKKGDRETPSDLKRDHRQARGKGREKTPQQETPTPTTKRTTCRHASLMMWVSGAQAPSLVV